MPAFILFAALFVYIMTQAGAMEGLEYYLVPDLRKYDRKLILAAMDKASSSTIGGCSMLVYGSYLSKKENLPKMAMNVTPVDNTAVAFIAGLSGYACNVCCDAKGRTNLCWRRSSLLSSDTRGVYSSALMFDSLGVLGQISQLSSSLLLTIAVLTSSISMLEGPVALVSERFNTRRTPTSCDCRCYCTVQCGHCLQLCCDVWHGLRW